ncbi:MAG: hypothetical protein O3B95_01680 [Chloroflexi bacterium]|nr:hypothetical protein [Chloroflexota bacterium]
MKYTLSSRNFAETIPMPWGLMAIFYGSTLAMVIGLVLPAFLGDEDVTGWVIWVYYPGMAVGLIVISAVSIWFRKLVVFVDERYLAFGYGRFRKRFEFAQIASVKVTPYSFYKYGGAGIRYARHGHRAWSIPFLHTGVEVQLREGTHDRTYYISSRRADELAEAIQNRIPTSGRA